MSLLENIAELRATHGNMSISKLERLAGLSRGSVAKWDEHIPSYDKLQKVAAVFGVTVEQLLSIKKAPTQVGEREELLMRFDSLSESDKAVLLATAKALAEAARSRDNHQ